MSKALLALSLAVLIPACPLFAGELAIDRAHSRITIHVGKAGLFSAAGHEHEVSAPIAEGAIDDSEASHVWLRVEAARMTVLPEKDQEAVQSTMQKSVLESAKFPEIRFEHLSGRGQHAANAVRNTARSRRWRRSEGEGRAENRLRNRGQQISAESSAQKSLAPKHHYYFGSIP